MDPIEELRKKKVQAEPHRNGNTVNDFECAGIKLIEAADELSDAICEIRAEIFHGRNYQHLDGAINVIAQEEDKRLIRRLQEYEGDMRAIAVAIAMKGEQNE